VNGNAPVRESHDATSSEHVNTALIDEMYRTYCDGNESVKDVNLKIAAVARQLASAVKLGQKAAHKDKDERQWRDMTRDLNEQLTASQHECQSVKSQLEILQRQLAQYDHVIKSPVSISGTRCRFHCVASEV
jgi:polyhydroxyalkanoate synthesis regulator phasin